MEFVESGFNTVTPPTREQLVELADAYGVAQEYWEVNGTHHVASDETLTKILEAMGADASCSESVQLATQLRREREWRRILPSCVVLISDHGGTVSAHVPHGAAVELWIELESNGDRRDMLQVEDWTEPRNIDGALVGQATFAIPAHLPLGYHSICARVLPPESSQTLTAEARLIVTPQRANGELLADGSARSWGMMMQLYSVRSRESWGIGDLFDLSTAVHTFGEDQADFVLINPLHAGEPVGAMQPSPYLPVSRRFFNPIYIRPESIPEWDLLDSATRAAIQDIGTSVIASSSRNELIDRNSVWEAKRAALELLFAAGRSPARENTLRTFRKAEGKGLEDFALWCALQEKSGTPLSVDLPPIDSPEIDDLRIELEDRIDFWVWLQWIMDEQLCEAQHHAKDAGMRYGICHDLAVGVHPKGAERWALADAFAPRMNVGAPPDFYNQQGQNWTQPPWNPVALEDMEYAPLRDMVRTILRHAGALRLDHVMGLFRLYWIPEGVPASEGTYVYYNHEAMLGIVLLEACRAGAVIVGEDLGTVEPWIRDMLHKRGVLGTAVFWFEKQGDGYPKQPWDYRHDVLATVDTHDLPPAAGYWNEAHVNLRDKLGLLTEPVEQVRASAAWERELVMQRLQEHSLISSEPNEQEIIEAMHAYVCRTPSALVGVSLTDAVGEVRTQNQPGTDQEYPNWQVPLADRDGQPVLIEDISENARYRSLVNVMNNNM